MNEIQLVGGEIDTIRATPANHWSHAARPVTIGPFTGMVVVPVLSALFLGLNIYVMFAWIVWDAAVRSKRTRYGLFAKFIQFKITRALGASLRRAKYRSIKFRSQQ